MNKNSDIKFILSSFFAFNRWRRNDRKVESDYLERLYSLIKDESNIDFQNRKSKKTSPLRIYKKIKRSYKKVSTRLLCAFRFVSLLPAHIVQLYDLKKIASSKQTCAVVGLASSRLAPPSSYDSMRECWYELLRPVGGQLQNNDDSIVDKALSSENLLIFDPLTISQLWGSRTKLKAEKILVFDFGFVLICFVFSVFRRPVKKLHNIRSLLVEFSELEKKEAALLTLFVISYENIFYKLPVFDAVFLTNNSKLIEILRAYLLQLPSCQNIVEVLHGVCSIPNERYFSEIFECAEKSSYQTKGRHFFIPQISKPQLFGVFKAHSCLQKVAINSYLNQHFLSFTTNLKLKQHIHEELHHLGINDMKEPPVIITVFGNHPHGGDLFSSKSLLVELMIIKRIEDLMSKVTDDYLILYVPHPLLRKATIFQDYLKADNLKVYQNSVFCWFISDMVVSLISSASFEGQYFGAKSLVPMLSEDDYFPDEYLKTLTSPIDSSIMDFSEALNQFINDALCSPQLSMDKKIVDRLRIVGEEFLFDSDYLNSFK